ncbi:hypothetical protein A3L09_10305 [Thermococcus profundus]|uniref:Polysaccharide biosynthesis protein n=1 Tax=Thermococcus profundus TaxID=49899 RepID=A0A2Z2MFU4_THEPR|nr:permease [Thermococcus profundus]ASJ03622.1 hypothetical protein A3L09_10305 [Thermococcus profundus]
MELRDLARPTLHLTTATLISAITGLIFWWAASRFYSAGDIGTASAVISFLNLAFAVSTLGLNVGLIRFYGEFNGRGAGTTLIIMTALSLVLTGVYGILNPGKALGREPSFFGLLLATAAAGALYNVLGYLSVASGKTRTYVEMSLAYGLRVIPVPLMRSLGAPGLLGSFGFGLVLGLSHGWRKLRSHIVPCLDREFLRASFGVSLSNYIGNIVNLLPVYLMPTIILVELGREWTGYYYVGFTLGNIILVPITALSTILLREERTGQKFREALLLILIYWGASVVGIWLFGNYALLLFGEGYTRAMDMLKAVALGIGPAGVTYVGLAKLTVEKKPVYISILNVLRGGLFLLIGYLLLGRYGIAGVGMGWSLAHTATGLGIVVLWKKPKSF